MIWKGRKRSENRVKIGTTGILITIHIKQITWDPQHAS
jgi:hypothetical protein